MHRTKRPKTMLKRAFFIFFLLVSSSGFLAAVPEPEVSIQKVEGRTEALVKSETPEKRGEESGRIGKTGIWMEDNIMAVLNTSSEWLGKGADIFVEGVRTGAGFILSPVFKALDFLNWGKKK